MKYIIIGDIHGHFEWDKLVEEDALNIFVGDYFDPYEKIPFDGLKENFLEIIKYSETHKNCVLLLGNHDLSYWWTENYGDTNRFNYHDANAIHTLFMEHKDKFKLAYSINNQYLVTHAGVSTEWKKCRLPDVKDITPDNLAIEINKLLETDKVEAFNFGYNGQSFDTYGTSSTQSCVWIRPQTLLAYNIYANTSYDQIVGHTSLSRNCITQIKRYGTSTYFVDCLRNKPMCLKIELFDNNYLITTKSVI